MGLLGFGVQGSEYKLVVIFIGSVSDVFVQGVADHPCALFALFQEHVPSHFHAPSFRPNAANQISLLPYKLRLLEPDVPPL